MTTITALRTATRRAAAAPTIIRIKRLRVLVQPDDDDRPDEA
jgi:hypothetical protein